MSQLVTILTIAGSDSTGGAGIQADIKAAASVGCHALCAVTAVTAQNSHGVSGIFPVTPDFLESQLAAIKADVIPDAVKIGMLGSAENARVVADFISSLPSCVNVVTDPVCTASAGGNLGEDGSALLRIYLDDLFPHSTVITPNLKEAELIMGRHLDFPDGEDVAEMMISSAMEMLHKTGSQSVALKGGHLPGDNLMNVLTARDRAPMICCDKRIESKNLHGTGCVFSSLFAGLLAHGFNLCESFSEASRLMQVIIKRSCGYNMGTSDYGPLDILDLHELKPNCQQHCLTPKPI